MPKDIIPQKGGSMGLNRSAVRPMTGLWCLKAVLDGNGGEMVHRFDKPMAGHARGIMTAGVMHTATAERSGEYAGRLFVTDAAGKKSFGDPLPVTSRWQELLLDLKTASDEGVNTSQIVEMGIEWKAAREGADKLEVQTDTWAKVREYREHQGSRIGKGLFVEHEGMALHVGTAGQYEMTFYQRSGRERPWLEVRQAGRLTGMELMLLDQDRYDGLEGRSQESEARSQKAEVRSLELASGWPVSSDEVRWRWDCVWTSPVAAIVEVKQEVGPYDRLGEPSVRMTWRFMIYQWGQVFVHARWEASGGMARPMTWALVQEDREHAWGMEEWGMHAKTPEDADRLLNAIYPASVKAGLTTALPHQMQRGASVAMIAKSVAASAAAKEKNLWWWTKGGGKRIFGAGLAGGGGGGENSADCMLLVNKPLALMQAGAFAQYLVPPKVLVREGELDRNFPGDADNDGMVESYGFQAIRLSNGRARFTVYPQERPLFYLAYLFTIPATDRESFNLKNSRLLVNIDGKQFSDPPQFPDGSFLLQLPYVIDRPVQVEAIVVAK